MMLACNGQQLSTPTTSANRSALTGPITGLTSWYVYSENQTICRLCTGV